VYEDYGGANQRLTENLHYTAYGKVDKVRDPASREFTTGYDADGAIQSVSRTDVTPSVSLVSYTYGSSGVLNGMPTSVVDGLSGVTMTLSYSSANNTGTGEIVGK
jgi:hypothetical protein